MTSSSWAYIFKDQQRGRVLKINTCDRYFQFVAPDKDFGVKYDQSMTIYYGTVLMSYKDSESAGELGD